MDTMQHAARVGKFVAWTTAALTVITFAIAGGTPPLSGPYCEAADCFSYPFTGIESRWPRDYLWMGPAIVLTLLYLGLVACAYQYAAPARRIFGLFGVSAALLATLVLVGDYFVQLAVIQPSLMQGETDGIAMLTQFNPHGVFIALEELGYILMAVSYGCLAPVFDGRSKAERALRWVLWGGFAAMFAALAYYTLAYGLEREYRFEVAVISIVWLTLLAASILMATVFARVSRGLSQA